MPVSMMLRAKVRRSTIAAQRRGSVKVRVQSENDSLEAMATLFFSSFGEDLEEEFSAVPVEFHVPSSSMQSRSTRP